MICIARTFGAPETVPAGNVARSRSNGVDAVAELACHLGDEVRDVREALGLQEPLDLARCPGRQTRERSLRPRSTSITCSARSFSEVSSRSASPSPRAVVPAIGLRLARVPSSLHVRLGRRADERDAVELQQEEVRRRVDAAQRAVDGERRVAVVALCTLGEHDLEGVAAADVLLRSARRAARARRGRGNATSPAATTGSASGGSTRRASTRATSAGSPSEHLGSAGRRGRSGEARRRPRSGSRRHRARPRAAAPSAPASRCGRSRGSRRRPRRAARPPRRRRSGRRSRPASSARAAPGRRSRAGSTRVRSRAGAGTPPSGVRRSMSRSVVVIVETQNDPRGSSGRAVRAVARPSTRAGSRPARGASPTSLWKTVCGSGRSSGSSVGQPGSMRKPWRPLNC